MGWKKWPNWLKGGFIGLVGFIIFSLILYFTSIKILAGTQSGSDSIINLTSFLWLLGFILVGAILKSIFNKK